MKLRRLLLLVLLLAVGCDRPSGPGVWIGTVTGPGLVPGAAFLTVAGEGVVAIEGDGDTRVWANEAPGEDGVHRVVVIGPDGDQPLTFRVRVTDVAGPAPAATVVELADRENRRLQVTSEHRVRFRR